MLAAGETLILTHHCFCFFLFLLLFLLFLHDVLRFSDLVSNLIDDLLSHYDFEF